MGVEGFIESLDPKLKKLFENMITVMMIIMMLYAAITYIQEYLIYNHFMAWFNSSSFVTTTVVLVFLGIAYKMLKGGKLHFPEPDKDKETTFNIPDVYGVKKTKDQSQTKLNMPNPFGPKNQQQQMNIPNTMGQHQQRMNIPNPMGANTQKQLAPPQHWKHTNIPLKGLWLCPKCNSKALGRTCMKCGYQKQ